MYQMKLEERDYLVLTSSYLLWVTSYGDVEVGLRTQWLAPEQCPVSEYHPTRRCTLVTPTVFSDCLAAVETNDHFAAFACIYPEDLQELPWFETCAPAAPVCD